MSSWKEERDLLVAQTLAFVQQVATAHPGASQPLDIERPARLAQHVTSPNEITVSTAEAAAALSEKAALVSPQSQTGLEEVATPAAPQLLTAAMLADHAKPALYSALSERADILQRVATFKARQSQINREREAYYDNVQARIRNSLGNESGNGRL